MKTPLTDLQLDLAALSKTERQWTWLAKHAPKTKDQFFRATRCPDDQRPVRGCYACERAKRRGIIECSRCLLLAIWPLHCNLPGTAYRRWCDAITSVPPNIPAARKAALEIAAACRKKIKELTKGNG